MDNAPTPAHLAPAAVIDSDHPAVIELARRATGATARERAISLYYLVRDNFRYDPYRIDLSPAGLSASRVIENGYGWCVPKAALLAAVARAAGIPARVGYADVRNHLSTERMREVAQTDLYIWHGYTELWLEDDWVKATPAFNLSLCERFGIHPLDWRPRGPVAHGIREPARHLRRCAGGAARPRFHCDVPALGGNSCQRCRFRERRGARTMIGTPIFEIVRPACGRRMGASRRGVIGI
jgi:hypothetical protein